MRKNNSRSGTGQPGQGKDGSRPDLPPAGHPREDRKPAYRPVPRPQPPARPGETGFGNASPRYGDSRQDDFRNESRGNAGGGFRSDAPRGNSGNGTGSSYGNTRNGNSGQNNFRGGDSGRGNFRGTARDDTRGRDRGYNPSPPPRPSVFPGAEQRGLPYGQEPVSPLSAHAPAGQGRQRSFVRRSPGYSLPAPVTPSEPATRVFELLEPSAESLAVIARLGISIDEANPLSPRHRSTLRQDIRRLWEELTSNRESRNAEYLGTPASLSAYIRYFLPWNVYRLSAIFSSADFCLPPDAVLIDIGSGPLTMPIALYASRPELRDIPLTIYCVDRVERVVEAGRIIFETLCLKTEGRMPPWTIRTVRESFGAPLPERAHLVTAVNVFNEFFWKSKNPLGERAIDTARSLLSYTRENGSVFVMEPGDPRSGAFISALRAALIIEGAHPLGPCPHAMDCPMPGIFRRLSPDRRDEDDIEPGNRRTPTSGNSAYDLHPVVMPKKRDKYPWCHFGISTDKAPAWLTALSAEAGLPKDRAVMSYLWVVRKARTRLSAPTGDPAVHTEKERRARAGSGILVRVISDPFSLGRDSDGQYACSNLGYTLLKGYRDSKHFEPGTLIELQTKAQPGTDEKSGAIILPY